MMSGSGYGAEIAPSLIQEYAMPIESSGHSRGNPRLYELVEGAPKTGKSPTVWAWPQLMDYLKIAGQPVPGPWPPHQEPRPDPEEDSLPVAVAEPPEEAGPAETGAPGRHAAPTPHDQTPPQLGDTPAQRGDQN
jgi:hypothetical protein